MFKNYSSLFIKSLLGFFLILLAFNASSQARNGAINLTGGEGRWFRFNDDETGKAPLTDRAFTIEMWVKVTSNSSNDICFFDLRSKDQRLSVVRNSDTKFRVEAKNRHTGNNTSYWDFDETQQNVTFLNNWVHFAFTTDGGSGARIYINGENWKGYNLYRNNKKLEAIYPKQTGHSGDGGCYIGGSSLKGVKGKMYVGEVRIWETRLSDSEIKKYYNEEVNKSHPHWGDMIHYFQGTNEINSNGKILMDDWRNKYEGVGSNTDVRVGNFYPPVHPPSFNNNSFSLNYSAGDCESSNILVDWESIHNTQNYEVGNDVHYQLRRDEQEVYTGTTSSYRDTDVSSGDKFKYSLRTFFTVDGVRKYSDDELTNYGNITTRYDAPTISVSDDRCDAKIKVDWSWSGSNPRNFTLERAENSAFTTNKTTISSNISGAARSYTNTPPDIDKNYYYRLVASGRDNNLCVVDGTYSVKIAGTTSQPPAAPINVSLVQDLSRNQLKVDWATSSDNNATKWIVHKEKFDGTDQTDIDIPVGSTKYDDTDLELCQTYRYTIGASNECAEDGIFASTQVSGNISQDLSNYISELDVAKGYYPNHVRLEWDINGGLSLVDRFKVYRSPAESNDYKLLKVLENDLVYDDESALGGIFYKYKIIGEASCEDATIHSNEFNDIGFYNPYGVANGHVEYAGGNAVEGAAITFEKQGNQSGSSLYFDGTSDRINFDWKPNPVSGYTVEFWTRVEEWTRQWQAIMCQGDDSWRIHRYNNTKKLSFTVSGAGNLVSLEDIDDDQWHHIACTHTGDKIILYVDGVEQGSLNAGDIPISNYNLVIGDNNQRSGRSYKGWLDEVRIWDDARTEEEIVSNYNRILNAAEENLIAYWRCDEGIGNSIYDASKTGINFNKHHGTFVGHTKFSNEIPSSSQLSIKGITNEYGDYTVDYIPYIAGGEILKVTPSLGQHRFEPNSRTVYIGDGAQTHNGLDFKDISSFEVQGKVTYQNSNFPVEGVTLLVDGKQAVGINNQPVRTDEEGKYSISVPIGYHYIAVQKGGHVFSQGVFPGTNEFGDIELHEFLEPATVNFEDSTKIKVAGRIVGGTREGDKEILFNKSINNIGIADLEFKVQKAGYDLDLADNAVYNVIKIQTNAKSGEYVIEMIPEIFEVQKAGNDNYFYPSQDIPLLDLRNNLDLITAYDTTVTTHVDVFDTTYTYAYDSSYYHHKLNYVIRETPTVSVVDENGGDFEGDTLLLFINRETEERDTLILTDLITLDYPVFQMGKSYSADITLFEEYSNPDHPDGAIIDQVPVKDAEVVINNQLMINPTSQSGKTNSLGVYRHVFRAGVPNLSQSSEHSYTKTLEVDINTGAHRIKWREGNIFRGYILGEKPLEGTDFVSYGPEVVEMVLRDPPGSNSYAFIEQGSSFTKKQGWNLDVSSQSAFDIETKKGIEVAVGGGLVGPVVKTEYIDDGEIGLSIKREYNYAGEYVETYNFKKRISTSSDPLNVGSMADVYIGKAYNAFISKSKNFKLLPLQLCIDNGLEHLPIGNSDMALGIIEGIVFDEGKTSTMFIYSQSHIVNNLVPNLVAIRDNLIMSEKYDSKFTIENPFFGISNDNPSLQPMADELGVGLDTANLSYEFIPERPTDVDSVDFLNHQITTWLNAIATNEAEKAMASTIENISIDGAVGAFSSEIEEVHNSSLSSTSVRSMKFTWNSIFGFTTNKAGFKMKSKWNMDLGIKNTDSNGQSRSVKFGYVIDERDQGDYYSIDVKNAEGVQVFSEKNFSDFIDDKNEFVLDRLKQAGIAGGGVAGKFALGKLITKIGKVSTTKGNAIVAGILFAADVGYQVYEMTDMTLNAFETYDKMDKNNSYTLSGFHISSPIFTTRGGQTKCPYEPGEETSFYVDEQSNKPAELHVATLIREVPVIDVEPAIVSDVPDIQSATFELKLRNESESNSNNWFNLSILEESNPDGAIIKVDGVNPKRSFFVPAWETLSKTITVKKGKPEIMRYDSIGIILSSQCQFRPETEQEIISDTVYISVHFLPTCTAIDLKGIQEDWLVNYNNNDEMSITLTNYDINHGSLESVLFQFADIGGNPITPITWFTDTTSEAYQNYPGEKEDLNGQSEISYLWDLSSMYDKQYRIRAKSTCSDGSIYESEFYTGLFDRKPPKIFGTPEPSDAILTAGENISIQFDETIEAGLVKEHNIELFGVLNGTEIAHGTSVQFDGVNDYADISGVSINSKSFTFEWWMQREIGSAGSVLSKGLTTEAIDFAFTANGSIQLTFGSNQFNIDPSSYYTAVYPENTWNHWAISYNKESGRIAVYLNDAVIFEQSNIPFNAPNTETVYFARNAVGNNQLAVRIHEVRIWEKALTSSESYATMSVLLSGSEIGLYGYWTMDQGKGTLINDKAAGRNMQIHGSWSIRPVGHAFDFNGIDEVVAINGQNIVITDETDFSIEFWFKAPTPSSEVTLFSNGHGNGIEVYSDPSIALSINANSSGEIIVRSNGNEFVAVTTNPFDNNWHQFVLSVDRRANAKAYIDGELQNSTTGTFLGGLAGSKMWIGARALRKTPTEDSLDQYFTGIIDEFRVWNAVRRATQIDLYSNAKLRGEEAGLLAYYPFETYEDNMGTWIVNQTLEDQAKPEFSQPAGTATSTSAAFTEETPAIRDARPVVAIPFDFVINDDKIIITPNIEASRVENIILDIAVKDVQDVNGNRMLSTATWTAYLDRNQVIWKESVIELTKEVNEELSFSNTVQNLGGVSYEYELLNLPEWLTTSQTIGVISPSSELTIDFDVNPGLNIGSYEHTISLRTSFGFDEKLIIKIRVTGEEPVWEVNPTAYNHTMNVIGQVIINGIVSTDPYDKVAAFVGDDCRGVANLQYLAGLDRYEVFLDIYSNLSSGEEINFKVWNSSEGRQHTNVTPKLNFVANSIHGTPSTPIDITADNSMSISLDLSKGWNWISFNLDNGTLNEVNSTLSEIGESGDIFKTDPNYFDQFDEVTNWFGSISGGEGILAERGYKLKLSKAYSIELQGVPINPLTTPITIEQGWNSIGYIGQLNLSVEEALATLTPQSGDLLKSQKAFAIYDASLGWVGSLTHLEPNVGYMLNTQSTGTLIYPKKGTLSKSPKKTPFDGLPENWKINPSDYENNMSMVAFIENAELAKLTGNELLIAFDKNKCVGYAETINGMYFITLYGKTSSNLSFSVYDEASKSILSVLENVTFNSNDRIGTVKDAYPLHIELKETSQSVSQIYPNPFSDHLSIVISLQQDSDVTIEIYDQLGAVLYQNTSTEEQGEVTIQWDGTDFLGKEISSGLYFLNVKSNQQVETHQLIKLN